MADGYVMQLASMMVLTAAKLAAPLLLTALLIGFAVSLIQALTQLQDQTIAFVPKIIGVGVALIISGNWMIQTLVNFTFDSFQLLPSMLGSG
ncbi:MAG: flagellar biosynthetic protein FliQ [Candidatus Nanopelagicales bacterium]|nr:flagellar biosynthetic protein FliQ [Candidatus Nanopelagicales bacterium]